MRKLVDRRQYYRINGGEWIDTSMFKHYHYKEESKCDGTKVTLITNFEQAVQFVEDDRLINGEVEYSFFRHIPTLKLPSGNWLSLNMYTYINEKKFESLEIKIEYEPAETLTLKALASLLNADEFCAYLKDRGISQCPMIK